MIWLNEYYSFKMSDRDSGTMIALTHATQIRYPASAYEMLMWSPSRTDSFPLGTQVSCHTKTIQTNIYNGTILLAKSRRLFVP